MEHAQKTLIEAVRRRLKELEKTPYAVEKAAGLPEDAIRSILRGGRKTGSTLNGAQAVCDALDLELYIGSPRSDPAPVALIKDEPFDTVARFDAQSAAGNGIVNFDGEPIDHLAFSKRWLAQSGINAGASVLINVRGDSMEPSIYDGDLVMLDRRRTAIRSGRIYVFRDPDEGLRVKRLEVIEGAAISLRSDNPKYPPEHRTGEDMNRVSENIIGEVVWSGHTWI